MSKKTDIFLTASNCNECAHDCKKIDGFGQNCKKWKSKFDFKEFEAIVRLECKPMPETFRKYNQNIPFGETFKPYCHPLCKSKVNINDKISLCLLGTRPFLKKEDFKTHFKEGFIEYDWEEIEKMDNPDTECFLTTRMCYRCEECLNHW